MSSAACGAFSSLVRACPAPNPKHKPRGRLIVRKVDLPPAFGPAEFSDALAGRHADVSCHAFIMEVVFTLYVDEELSFTGRDLTILRLGDAPHRVQQQQQ